VTVAQPTPAATSEQPVEHPIVHQLASSNQKHLLIVGAGAVGQLLGSLTAARGHHVSFLLKPSRVLSDIVVRDLDHACRCK
jgi:pyruvate/2-oxoglutarate dehydrogenase complex dihydrolipoamide dehydrogenase (E3) component